MKFTTINHEARIELGLTMNEYAVADSIYHLSNSPTYKEKINKTYLADFFHIERKNILLIINRLIEKWLLNKEWNKTTIKWVEITQLNELKQLSKTSWNDTQYIYNNNIIETPIIPLGDEANKKEKELHKTDLSFISTEEIIDWWNNDLPKSYKFPQFKWKKGMKGYEDLHKQWLMIRNRYDKELFNNWMENYMKEIDWRNPIHDYSKHRFTLYEWIKQSNALLKFSSL